MKTPGKPDHVSQQDWDDADMPEWTAEDFARARPFQEVFPDLYASWKRDQDQTAANRPRVHMGFRLAADVADGIRATGKGYTARVETVLREALEKGRL